MEVGVAAVRWLEREGRRPERLRYLRVRLGPDESISGRVSGAGGDLADVVGLQPELKLCPHRLHGRGDDRVLLSAAREPATLRSATRVNRSLRLRDCASTTSTEPGDS